jgi:hypothetical protein
MLPHTRATWRRRGPHAPMGPPKTENRTVRASSPTLVEPGSREARPAHRLFFSRAGDLLGEPGRLVRSWLVLGTSRRSFFDGRGRATMTPFVLVQNVATPLICPARLLRIGMCCIKIGGFLRAFSQRDGRTVGSADRRTSSVIRSRSGHCVSPPILPPISTARDRRQDDYRFRYCGSINAVGIAFGLKLRSAASLIQRLFLGHHQTFFA